MHLLTVPLVLPFFSLHIYSDKCEEIDPNRTCTPISGFMTAYLGPGSDKEASIAAMLAHVEQGMESGTYLNNEIIKVSFIGTRSSKKDGGMTTAELGVGQETNDQSLAIGLSVFFLGFAALIGFTVMHTRKKKKRHSNNSDTSAGASAQMSRNTIGVDTVEIIAHNLSAPVNNKYDNSIGSVTLSSSGGDEEDQKYEDLKYGITEDYGDLVGTFTQQDTTPLYSESCLAVIESGSDLDEMRSFETGTPRTSPRNVPNESVMPDMMSPLSIEEELLEPETEYDEMSPLSPASSTEADMFRSDVLTPVTSTAGDSEILSHGSKGSVGGGMLGNEEDMMSPLSSKEELLEPKTEHDEMSPLSPASSTEADMFRSDVLTPVTSTAGDSDILSYGSKGSVEGGMLGNETAY